MVATTTTLSPQERAAWLQDRMAAVGIASFDELDAAFGGSNSRRWAAGMRPRASHIPAIAEALQVADADVFGYLWGERPGDPCGCGCPGVKERPRKPGARVLATRRVCEGCGEVHIYDGQAKHRSACRRCMGRSNIEGFRAKVIKNDGRDALPRRRRPFSEEEAARGRQAAAMVTTGTPKSAEHNLKNALAQLLKPQPSRNGQRAAPRWGQCRICRMWCHDTSPREGSLVAVHKRCLDEWRRGRPGSQAYPPRPRGRMFSAEEIQISYALTVRHRQGESATSLAQEFGIAERWVYLRMERFIDLLPKDERGGKWLTRVTKILTSPISDQGSRP